MPALNGGDIALRLTIAFLSLATLSCGLQKTMTFKSPSGSMAIEVWQTRIDNTWGTRIDLLTASGRQKLLDNTREAHVSFVHVYWTPDERIVAVVVTGANQFHIAAATATGVGVPFASVRNQVARSISETYHLPPNVDAIGWSSMADAQAEFFRIHPEIKVTYR
jgi:hypothetical protein